MITKTQRELGALLHPLCWFQTWRKTRLRTRGRLATNQTSPAYLSISHSEWWVSLAVERDGGGWMNRYCIRFNNVFTAAAPSVAGALNVHMLCLISCHWMLCLGYCQWQRVLCRILLRYVSPLAATLCGLCVLCVIQCIIVFRIGHGLIYFSWMNHVLHHLHDVVH